MQNKTPKQNVWPQADLSPRVLHFQTVFSLCHFLLAQNDKQIYVQRGIYEGRSFNYFWVIAGVNKVGCEKSQLDWDWQMETLVIKVFTWFYKSGYILH